MTLSGRAEERRAAGFAAAAVPRNRAESPRPPTSPSCCTTTGRTAPGPRRCYRATSARTGAGAVGATDLAAVPASPPATAGGVAAAASTPARSPSKRGRLDAVIAGHLLYSWHADERGERPPARPADGDRLLVTVPAAARRTRKAGREPWGSVKDGVAHALRTLRPAAEPGAARTRSCPLPAGWCGLRFAASLLFPACLRPQEPFHVLYNYPRASTSRPPRVLTLLLPLHLARLRD